MSTAYQGHLSCPCLLSVPCHVLPGLCHTGSFQTFQHHRSCCPPWWHGRAVAFSSTEHLPACSRSALSAAFRDQANLYLVIKSSSQQSFPKGTLEGFTWEATPGVKGMRRGGEAGQGLLMTHSPEWTPQTQPCWRVWGDSAKTLQNCPSQGQGWDGYPPTLTAGREPLQQVLIIWHLRPLLPGPELEAGCIRKDHVVGTAGARERELLVHELPSWLHVASWVGQGDMVGL